MSKKTVQKSKKRTTRTNKKRTPGVKANTVVKTTPVTSEKATDVKPVEVPKKAVIVEPKETVEKVVRRLLYNSSGDRLFENNKAVASSYYQLHPIHHRLISIYNKI